MYIGKTPDLRCQLSRIGNLYKEETSNNIKDQLLNKHLEIHKQLKETVVMSLEEVYNLLVTQNCKWKYRKTTARLDVYSTEILINNKKHIIDFEPYMSLFIIWDKDRENIIEDIHINWGNTMWSEEAEKAMSKINKYVIDNEVKE